MLGLFITGVRPNSGKTFLTAGLAATMQSLGYSSCVYKPVETGAVEKEGYIQAPDLVFVKNIDKNIKTYCSYLFRSKNLPCFAAYQENSKIEKDIIQQDFNSIIDDFDCILVNGLDGIAIPYGRNFYEENLVQALNLPILFVVSPQESSLNDILTTLDYTRSRNISVRGIIINDYPEDTANMDIKHLHELIEQHTDVKVLGIIPHVHDAAKIKPEDMISYILAGVDIEAVFDVKIARLSM